MPDAGTILLVEDEAPIANQEADMLRKEGYGVELAGSGQEAIARLRAEPKEIELILMDIDLGNGMDGAQAAREILKENDLPIIFLSTGTGPGELQKIEQITAYGYVVKNTGHEVLAVSIKMALQLHAAHRARLPHTGKHSLTGFGNSEANLRGVFTNSPDTIYTLDLTSKKVTLLNRETFCGYSKSELEQPNSILAAVHPGDLPLILDNWQQMISGQEALPVEFRLRRKDGELEWIEQRISVLSRNPDGSSKEIMVNLSMITGRKRAEALQRRYYDYQAALQETTLELLAQLDLDTLLKNILRRAAALVGAPDGYLALMDPATGLIQPKVGMGAIAGMHFKVMLGEGVARRVWQSGQPLVINDYDNWEGNIVGFTPGLLSAVIAVPLLKNGQALGVLGLAHEYASHRTFEQDAVEIMTQFARLAVLSIENARLFTTAHQELAERQRTEISLRDSEARLKRSLQEKEILMHELQHRVKNNLAVASGLLSIEEERLPDDRTRAIFANTRSRLRSMSALYEQLYRTGETDRIDLRQYIRNLVEALAKTYIPQDCPVNIETQLEAIQLGGEQTMPLGIIINELFTNALKHAFPAWKTPRGDPATIHVELAQANGQVRLCVRDNGAGLALKAPKSGGLGLELVDMLTQQIDGRFSIANANGCTACVEFHPG